MSLLIKTDKGGFRQDISSAWNTKLTAKRIKSARNVSMGRLYSDISKGYDYFWSRRRVLPEANGNQ